MCVWSIAVGEVNFKVEESNPNQISLAVEMSKVRERERERDYVRLYSLFPSQCYTNICLVYCNNNNDVFYCAV